MSKTVTIESKNHKYANTYGGLICQSDFCTDFTNGNITDRIFSDWKFDNQCKRNIESRNRKNV